MKKIISMMIKDQEIARVSKDGLQAFINLNSPLAPKLQDWYNASFYGIKNAKTFEERWDRVEENNYFCYLKPHLVLVARTIEE